MRHRQLLQKQQNKVVDAENGITQAEKDTEVANAGSGSWQVQKKHSGLLLMR